METGNGAVYEPLQPVAIAGTGVMLVVSGAALAPEIAEALSAYGAKKAAEKLAKEKLDAAAKDSLRKEAKEEINRLREVERKYREQLDNGRNQATREMAQGKTPNPHGLWDEITRTIPDRIRKIQDRIRELEKIGK